MGSVLANQIARLPENYECAEQSTASLLRAIGFPERRLLLETAELAIVFQENPHLILKWMARAGDQRIMGGWGIEKDGDRYRVQRFGGHPANLMFDDHALAVAEFAFRYVQFIADVLARSG